MDVKQLVISPDEQLDVLMADGFWSRFIGLMFRRDLPEQQALLLTPCNRIHSCFMRFPLDVIYLDQDWRVLDRELLKPWRTGKKVKGCKQVLEAAVRDNRQIEVGAVLELT